MRQEAQRRELNNLHLPGRFPVETMLASCRRHLRCCDAGGSGDIQGHYPQQGAGLSGGGRPILACLNGEGRIWSLRRRGIGGAGRRWTCAGRGCIAVVPHAAARARGDGARGRLYYAQHFAHAMLIDQLIGHLRSVCDD